MRVASCKKMHQVSERTICRMESMFAPVIVDSLKVIKPVVECACEDPVLTSPESGETPNLS